MDNFHIEQRVPTAAEYNRLRSAIRWPEHVGLPCDRALRGSLFCVCALAAENLIGMGRVVGDGGIYFYIQDVIVVPEWQHRGVGSRIMDALMRYLSDESRPGVFIGLMAAQGAAGFYERYGFRRRPDDRPGMFIQLGNKD